MPRTAAPVRQQIRRLLGEFAERLTRIVEANASRRPVWTGDVRARVLAVLGMGGGRGPGRPSGSKSKRARKRRRVSAAQRKANRLQGAYLGNIRLLSAGDKAKVKAERKKKGVGAAINLAKQLKTAA